MDVVSHGLWGAAAFCPQGRKKFLGGLLAGMAPDLLSFGVFHVMHPGWIALRLAGQISGPPALSMLPAYVFHAYNVTHSLVVWGAIFLALWIVVKPPAWILWPWLLHVLCDIPTHSTEYFPTPFLWPLATPFVNGIAWTTPWFLALNYGCLVTAYGVMLVYLRLKRRGPET